MPWIYVTDRDTHVQLAVGSIYIEELTPWYINLVHWWREGEPNYDKHREIPDEAVGSLVDTMRGLK